MCLQFGGLALDFLLFVYFSQVPMNGNVTQFTEGPVNSDFSGVLQVKPCCSYLRLLQSDSGEEHQCYRVVCQHCVNSNVGLLELSRAVSSCATRRLSEKNTSLVHQGLGPLVCSVIPVASQSLLLIFSVQHYCLTMCKAPWGLLKGAIPIQVILILEC